MIFRKKMLTYLTDYARNNAILRWFNYYFPYARGMNRYGIITYNSELTGIKKKKACGIQKM